MRVVKKESTRYRVFFRSGEVPLPVTWEQDIAWACTDWEPGVLTCAAPIPGIEPDATRQRMGEAVEYLYFGDIEVIDGDA